MKPITIVQMLLFTVAIAAASWWMGQQSYGWLPPQAATEAKLIDDLFSFLVALGTFIFLGVTGFIAYSLVFHRAPRYDLSDGPAIEGNVTLEVIWTALPILLVFLIAGYSYQTYEQMAIRGPMEVVHLHMPGMESAYAADATSEPVEAIEVHAKQWAWSFRYPEQNVTSTELHLPVNHRIRLAMQSEDVIHGFFVPAFRLKQDIIPKRTIEFEFTPVREGKYRLSDSQFSGTYFATMQTNVVVESPQAYQQWLTQTAAYPTTPASNPAYAEYTQQIQQPGFKTGWATVKPATPPLVNQPSQAG
ncbi:cytochrome c oxidase subunit II [Pantanalinema sp. GBBB05]|uniref:cytochrome c oxidase subunit II n=1 Tax=Pantanalinema sp. GBBB05 TaxID=2604139 RepID=UPI001D490824|nr:cytochrome c oxidase subunit II [Pantanalinema sp. GBBB05]